MCAIILLTTANKSHESCSCSCNHCTTAAPSSCCCAGNSLCGLQGNISSAIFIFIYVNAQKEIKFWTYLLLDINLWPMTELYEGSNYDTLLTIKVSQSVIPDNQAVFVVNNPWSIQFYQIEKESNLYSLSSTFKQEYHSLISFHKLKLN